MDETKKAGKGLIIVQPKPSDYVLGANSPIQGNQYIADWSLFLPNPENQFNSKFDFLICTTMSAIHSLEAQLNVLLLTNQLSDEAFNFFRENKYIVNGKFDLSARFNAKLNGTGIAKGNDQITVGQCFRRDGFIPDSLWPMTISMTWDEYYTEIPQSIKDIGQKAKWFIEQQYQWTLKDSIPIALKTAPVQIATAVCPGWNSGQMVNKCTNKPIQHASLVYGMNGDIYLNLDQYSPYKQTLSPDYDLPYNVQYVLTVKPMVLRMGMHGENIMTMQENLSKLGYKLGHDSFFGGLTKIAVMEFQKKYNLTPDGIAGPLTLKKLSEVVSTPKSKLDMWCQAIKIMEGAKPERNNPGNIRFIGQQYAVNDRGFCKFDTYQHGYEALKTLLVNACTGKSKFYNSSGNLYDFYKVYAPSSDGNNPKHYAEFVANYIGVDPLTVIKTLI